MKIGITGIGSYIPSIVTKNEDFLQHQFMETDGTAFEQQNNVIIEKFQAITGIANRRYAKPELKTSDLGYLAAEEAISNAGVDKEEWVEIVWGRDRMVLAQQL